MGSHSSDTVSIVRAGEENAASRSRSHLLGEESVPRGGGGAGGRGFGPVQGPTGTLPLISAKR